MILLITLTSLIETGREINNLILSTNFLIAPIIATLKLKNFGGDKFGRLISHEKLSDKFLVPLEKIRTNFRVL